MKPVINGIYQHKQVKDIVQVTKIEKQYEDDDEETVFLTVISDPNNAWGQRVDFSQLEHISYTYVSDFLITHKPLPYYNSPLYKAINGSSYKSSQPNTPSDKSSVVATVPSANASLTATASKTLQNPNKPEN